MVQFFALAIILCSTASAQHHGQNKDSGPDLRKPLPLLEFMAEHQKKNMREHLEAIRDIVGGFAKKDFKVIKEASLNLGSSPQMNMMCDIWEKAHQALRQWRCRCIKMQIKLY